MPRDRDEVDSDVEIEDATNRAEDDPEGSDGEEEDEEEYEIEAILDAKHGHFAKARPF